jgi:hypothetical protein
MTKYIATLLAVLLTACGGHAPTSETYLGTGGSPEAGAPGDDPTGGNDDTGGNHTGGNSPTGGSSGTSTGGTGQDPTGGATTGGNATGGSQTGGMSGEAGAATGGDSTGGTETGGTVTTGGTETGGTVTTGGTETGGTVTTGGSIATGGSHTGGTAGTGGTVTTGGTETGGTADTGGSQTGGTSGTGGTETGGTGGTVNPLVCSEATKGTFTCDGLDRLYCQYATGSGLFMWVPFETCPEGPNGCYNGQCADCPADARACSTEGDAIICAPDDTGKYVWSLDEECLYGCAVEKGLCHECELGKWSCGANVSKCVTGGGVNRMTPVLTGTTAEPAVKRCYFGCNADEGCLRTNQWMTPTQVLIDGVNTTVSMLSETGKFFYGVKIEPGTDPQAVCAANGHFWTNGSTGYWLDAGFVSGAWTVGSGWMLTAGETAVGLNPTEALTLNRVFPDDLPLTLVIYASIASHTAGQIRFDCGDESGVLKDPQNWATSPYGAIPVFTGAFNTPTDPFRSDCQIHMTGSNFTGELSHVWVWGGYPTIWNGMNHSFATECMGAVEENIIPYDAETCPDEWVITPSGSTTPDYVENGEAWYRVSLQHAGTYHPLGDGYLVYDEATENFLRVASRTSGEFTDPMWVVCSNQENDSLFVY